MQVQGALDTAQTIAVSQQLVAFAVLIGFEGQRALTGMRPDNPGRPTVVLTAASAASMLVVRRTGLK
jgi:hypothetical protein